MATKKRFDAIQTLRFMCFLMVFGEHAGFYKEFGIPSFGELCAMSVFLMMSGFLMVYSYMDRDTPSDLKGCFRFTTGKIKKLYPLHVETAVIQFIFIIILYWEMFAVIDQTHLESWLFKFGVNLALMQAWVPDFHGYVFNFNGPSWFLSVMLFAYFMFPLILKLLKKLETKKKILIFSAGVMVIGTAAVLIMFAFTGADSDVFTWFTQNSPILRIIDFYYGCVAGYIYMQNRKAGDPDSKPHSKVKWTFLELGALLMFYIISTLFVLVMITGFGGLGKAISFCQPLIAPIFTLPTLMVFIWERGYITAALKWKPLVYLGNISMYTYLIHYIFTMGWSYFCQGQNIDNTGMTRIIAIIVEFALTIVTSMLYDKFQKHKAKVKKEKAEKAKAV